MDKEDKVAITMVSVICVTVLLCVAMFSSCAAKMGCGGESTDTNHQQQH